MSKQDENFDDLIQTLKTLPAQEGAELVSLYHQTSRYRDSARPGNINDIWYGAGGGQTTAAGTKVDERSALKFAPVYAAVKAISQDIASLPLNLNRITGRKKEKATDLPLYRTLHLQPNPEQTRIQMWESLISHILLWGNCYAHLQQPLVGPPTSIWPLDPSRMQVKRPDPKGPLVYEYTYTDDGKTVRLPPWEILHIGGLGFNGLIGYSVIGLMRESIGLGLSQEEYASRFYSNGALANGVLETAGTIDAEGKEDLQKWWNDNYGGVTNAHKTILAAQGLNFHPFSVPQKDAQFLEGRNFSVRDIARWFGIPGHRIGDLERATWGNIEFLGIDYVVYTLRPLLVRIEQAMEVKFNLGPDYEIRHIVEGLLRGDSAARAAFYKDGVMTGYMTRNQVRELEDWNPLPGLDKPLVPQSNATPQDSENTNGNGKDKKLDKEAFRMMFQKLSHGEKEDLVEMLGGSDAS